LKPRSVTAKNPDEVYDLKWLNNGDLSLTVLPMKISFSTHVSGKLLFLIE
jgi:hypothetical protein